MELKEQRVQNSACIDSAESRLKKAKGLQKRTTPEFITELQPNEIFVFGSNLKGMHGGGAAYIAYRKFGAIMGQGVGLQGQSYGIPTMQGGVETIRPYVDEFIQFAKEHPTLTFLVTRSWFHRRGDCSAIREGSRRREYRAATRLVTTKCSQEEMMQKKIWIISAILIVCGLPLLTSCSKDETDDEQPPQKVTRWECILFGSYPANEVVSGSFYAVDDYALVEGDVITDAALYSQLEQAAWTDDDTEIGGKRYHRLNGAGAVSCSTNREQHYRWTDTEKWHYFAYAPIKWRILKQTGDKAVLLADRMPDTCPFNDIYKDTSWSDCSLRQCASMAERGVSQPGLYGTGEKRHRGDGCQERPQLLFRYRLWPRH